MAGETWGAFFQGAVETTPGTPVVPATRRFYFNNPDSVLSRTQPTRPHRFSVGRRDNVMATTMGMVSAGGSVAFPTSADEIIELLQVGIQGSVVPSTGVWTFLTSGTSWTIPQAMSLQWFDGANAWIANGCQVGRYRFSGAKDGDSTVTCDLFARDVVTQAMNPAAGTLGQRTPSFFDGWQSSLFIDPTTYGSTAAAMLLNWDITLDNQLGRKYFNNNSQAASGITLGELQINAQLTVEASVSAAATEFANWIAAAPVLRRVRVQFPGATANNLALDIPGYWSAFDLGQNAAGTRVYQLNLTYNYDVTNAFGMRFQATSARTAAFNNT
jgi:hypothetical protein